MPPAATTLVRTAWIIWLGMLLATGGYLLALVIVLASDPSAAPTDVSTLRHVLMIVALVPVAAVYVVRRRLPLEASAVGPSPSPEQVFTTYVLCWALSEVVAIFGLVLGIVGRSVAEAQPFLMVAAALLLWQRPRPADFGA